MSLNIAQVTAEAKAKYGVGRLLIEIKGACYVMPNKGVNA
jgi:hypothetical protein